MFHDVAMATLCAPSTTSTSLPWSPLLALGTAVFITSLTETLPAGLLPDMSTSLGVSPGATGQAVTVYAAGTALTAILLARATARLPRKPLLTASMLVFLLANTLTAVAPTFAVLLAGRLLAGIAAGLAWAILAGYARAIAPRGLEGRAIAVAMTGIPVALSLGVPAGTFIGQQVGWRAVFGLVSAITLGVIAWIALSVPTVAAAGSSESDSRATTRVALRTPGVAPIMIVVTTFVLAHTVMYAYIAPFLKDAALGSSIDTILLAFGVACLVSIWYVGRHVDHRLRTLSLLAAVLFTLATATMAATTFPPVLWCAAIVWGLGWGGTPTLLQTAAAHAATKRSTATADTAQAILVTLWNAAMAAGGIIGGLILNNLNVIAIPIAAAALGVVSLLVLLAARRSAFPQEKAAA